MVRKFKLLEEKPRGPAVDISQLPPPCGYGLGAAIDHTDPRLWYGQLHPVKRLLCIRCHPPDECRPEAFGGHYGYRKKIDTTTAAKNDNNIAVEEPA